MEITFDKEAKAVYIYLSEVTGKPKHKIRSTRTEEIEKDTVFVDRDAAGKAIGIEVLGTSMVTLKVF